MIYNPLIIVALKSVLCTSAKLNIVQIGASRTISTSNRTAYQLSAVVMQCLQGGKTATHELALVAQNEDGL